MDDERGSGIGYTNGFIVYQLKDQSLWLGDKDGCTMEGPFASVQEAMDAGRRVRQELDDMKLRLQSPGTDTGEDPYTGGLLGRIKLFIFGR